MNFLNILRPFKNPFNNSFKLNTIRGAKRKGEKKQDGILSEHILNLYKNSDDISVLPNNYYPPWVFDLARPSMELEEFVGNAALGITIPANTDQHTMTKKARRWVKIKYTNRMKHAKAPYEKKWDMQIEGMENQLDVEFGNLPEVINEMVAQELKNETSEGGAQGGQGGQEKKQATIEEKK